MCVTLGEAKGLIRIVPVHTKTLPCYNALYPGKLLRRVSPSSRKTQVKKTRATLDYPKTRVIARSFVNTCHSERSEESFETRARQYENTPCNNGHYCVKDPSSGYRPPSGWHSACA